MDDQNIQQSQTFEVKVNPDGGAVIDGSTSPQPKEDDYKNNPDYVPDDPTSDESPQEETEQKSDEKAEPKLNVIDFDGLNISLSFSVSNSLGNSLSPPMHLIIWEFSDVTVNCVSCAIGKKI